MVTDTLTEPKRPPVAAAVAPPYGREVMWGRIAELVDRAPSLDALRAHRLQLLAASLWREQGRLVPDELAREVRSDAAMTMAAPMVLKRARAAYGGRLMLMKGPEVAARYPTPGSRRFQDLDLLADDPERAQRALIDAGFIEIQTGHDYTDDQHLCPLGWPGLPLAVELHRRPSCKAYLTPPPRDEVLAMTVPSATGIDGLLAPRPAAHALLLVAHAWTHLPLGRVGDLIDLAVTLPDGDRDEADALARRWGWERMWHTTLAVADALLTDEPAPAALRTWARHLAEVRELSVVENHIVKLTAPTFALPLGRAPRGVGLALRDTVRPSVDESWPQKLHRSVLAARHAFRSKSRHERQVGLNPWSR